MKKAFLILIIAVIASPSWSQSLSTVRGKTKDGKSLHVTYYHGATEDYIESVNYQLIDELKANVAKLQADNKELQGKLDAANKRIKETEKNADRSANEQITNLQSQIEENEGQIVQLNLDIKRLQLQLDSTTTKADTDYQRLQKTISEKDHQRERPAHYPAQHEAGSAQKGTLHSRHWH